MPDRRRFLLAVAALAIMSGSAHAQSWKSQYPELVLAIVPAENASGVSDRYADFTAYLAKELGVPVVEGIGAPIRLAHMLVHLKLNYSRSYWPKSPLYDKK